MGATVNLSQQARRDLRAISAFISRNNPTRARTFCRDIAFKARGLGNHPRMDRVVPEIGDESVREIVHGAYRIIYALSDEPVQVFILRFRHGARGTPEIVED